MSENGSCCGRHGCGVHISDASNSTLEITAIQEPIIISEIVVACSVNIDEDLKAEDRPLDAVFAEVQNDVPDKPE